jgi:hypothetical protein
MVDDSTTGAARRPPFTSKAARPRLGDLRRRTDRPSFASSACSTALGHQPDCCPPVAAFRAFVRRTWSYHRDIDSDRRCLKPILLPSPARRRGAIPFHPSSPQFPRLSNALPFTCEPAARARPLDDTAISLRRDRQVQRLVRQQDADASTQHVASARATDRSASSTTAASASEMSGSRRHRRSRSAFRSSPQLSVSVETIGYALRIIPNGRSARRSHHPSTSLSRMVNSSRLDSMGVCRTSWR